MSWAGDRQNKLLFIIGAGAFFHNQHGLILECFTFNEIMDATRSDVVRSLYDIYFKWHNGKRKKKKKDSEETDLTLISSFILAGCGTMMLKMVHLLGNCEGGFGEIITYLPEGWLWLCLQYACQP